MFHLRFGLSDHLKALLDFVFGSRRRVKKVRIFRAWFSQQLVRASQHLLRFLLAGHTTQNDFMHAETLSHVFKPLVELPDRHLLASAVGLTLALITGRTDLCSADVFGAGKTRAAAAVIVGLIAIDPTLSIMICTKENAAAQAVAEHIVSMQLPDALLDKFGRLIGFHEAQKGASARTAIDVESQNRNQVLRGKQVIIGCEGRFRHETAQKYSSILEWMAKTQLCLHDEAQQFGNLDEVAALARLPHARDALWRGFRRAQEEMDRLRGRHLPTIDFNIAAALKRLLAHDRAREVSRAQMLKVHVNMAVWRDRYGRLWRRKLT